MHTCSAILPAALLAWTLTVLPAVAAPALQDRAMAQAGSPVTAAVTDPACRLEAGQRQGRLAQGMPVDCCKGHKGVCGCRAGKIVCCDGTVSKEPNCTCHSDWGMEN